MIFWLKRIGVIILITILTVVINISLFSIFPVLHRTFSSVINNVYDLKPHRSIIMEFKKPQKQKTVRVREKIQKISNPGFKGSKGQLSFKFSPDLSVEGTGTIAMEETDLEAVVFEEGETDEDVIPLNITPVSYPQRARDLGIQGILEAVIVVGRDGRVESVKILKSPHTTITKEAKKTILKWRFKPAQNKGIPVKVRVKQVIEFKLD